MQETSFPVEIFIHDDASNDATAKIIAEYAARHPNIFRVSLQCENHWKEGVRYYNSLLKSQKGEFIAFCEGDDYWVTPNKLELQVAMLEENGDSVLSLHAIVVDSNNKLQECEQKPKAGIIAQGGFFRKECERWQTSALVLRASFVASLPDWVNHLAFGDVPLLALASLRGPLCCIPGTHSAYRIHSLGFYSNLALETDPKERLRKNMRWDGELAKMFRALIHETEQPTWTRFLMDQATAHTQSVVWSARLLGDYAQLRRSILEAIKTDAIGVFKSRMYLRSALFAVAPWFDFKRAKHLQKYIDTFNKNSE